MAPAAGAGAVIAEQVCGQRLVAEPPLAVMMKVLRWRAEELRWPLRSFLRVMGIGPKVADVAVAAVYLLTRPRARLWGRAPGLPVTSGARRCDDLRNTSLTYNKTLRL